VGAAALLCGLALAAYRRGEPRTAAAAIVAAGVVLRLFAGADLFLHTWDERYHALVAKNLIGHPLVPTLYDDPALPYDYRDWHATHVWLHKPPLAMWLMAGSMALLGVDELALRLPSLVLAGLAIFFTYVIGSHLFGRRVGLLGAAFHAIHGYLLQLPGGRVPVDHIDNDLIFFVELGVLLSVLYVRSGRRWLLAGIGAAAGLAVLTKWLPGLIVYPVWLALVWGRERPRAIAGKLAAMALVTAAAALPWQLYVHHAFPREAAWEAAYNVRHLSEPIEGLGGSPLFYLLHMPRYFGELIWLAVGAFLAAWVSGRGEAERMRPIGVWLAVPYLVFSLAATKMGAYVMTAAPAVFVIEAWFWIRLAEWRPGAAWLRGLRWAGLVLLVALPLRYGLERLKLGRDWDRNPPWARELRELPGRIGSGRVALFNLDRPIEAMFYTPYTAYSGLPTPAEARAMLRAGFRVVLLDHGDVPDRLRFPGVELIDNRGRPRDLGALNDH